MKLMTVKEYAEYKQISLPAVYKQIRENRVRFERKYGKLLVAVREKRTGIKKAQLTRPCFYSNQ